MTSAGVPSATMRPSTRTAIRSASASASSMKCVVSRTVLPRRESSRTIDQAPRRADGSNPVVGSSRNRSSGSPASAIARSRRRRWPPESFLIGVFACATRPTSSSSSSGRRGRRVVAGVHRHDLACGQVALGSARLEDDPDAGLESRLAARRVVAEHRDLAARARPIALERSRPSTSCRRRSARAARRSGRVPRRGRCRGRPRRSRTTCAGRGPGRRARRSRASPQRSVAPRARVFRVADRPGPGRSSDQGLTSL